MDLLLVHAQGSVFIEWEANPVWKKSYFHVCLHEYLLNSVEFYFMQIN